MPLYFLQFHLFEDKLLLIGKEGFLNLLRGYFLFADDLLVLLDLRLELSFNIVQIKVHFLGVRLGDLCLRRSSVSAPEAHSIKILGSYN